MYLKELLALVSRNIDSEFTEPPYVVLVGGGRCSGKTTVINGLRDLLKVSSQIILVDDFLVDEGIMRAREVFGNYDSPMAYDMACLGRVLRALKGGEEVEKPLKGGGSERIKPTQWIFVDGVCSLYRQRKRVADSGVFVDCDESTRRLRRIKAGVDEFGNPVATLDRYFEEVSTPRHARGVLRTKKNADIIYFQNKPPELNYKPILDLNKPISKVS